MPLQAIVEKDNEWSKFTNYADSANQTTMNNCHLNRDEKLLDLGVPVQRL